jgi:hypothetical protein
MELLLDRRRHDVIQPEAGCLGNSKALAIFVAPKTPESMFIVNEVTFDIYMILVSIMMKVS